MDVGQTLCSVGEGFPADEGLFLVLDDFEALSIESDLEVGEADGLPSSEST